MRPQADRIDLVQRLVLDPRLDQVVGEDTAGITWSFTPRPGKVALMRDQNEGKPSPLFRDAAI
jgi:hypothetical protein